MYSTQHSQIRIPSGFYMLNKGLGSKLLSPFFFIYLTRDLEANISLSIGLKSTAIINNSLNNSSFELVIVKSNVVCRILCKMCAEQLSRLFLSNALIMLEPLSVTHVIFERKLSSLSS